MYVMEYTCSLYVLVVYIPHKLNSPVNHVYEAMEYMSLSLWDPAAQDFIWA